MQALGGGELKWGHIEGLRQYVNKKLDQRKSFAIWRIESPWKPRTKKGKGTRMGGGKGAIHHYVTPVKADRIIIEVGGHVEFEEVEPFLTRAAEKLPFEAIAVSYEMLEEQARLEKELEQKNLNPFTFEHCLKNNFCGSRIWASTYDYIWFNKYR